MREKLLIILTIALASVLIGGFLLFQNNIFGIREVDTEIVEDFGVLEHDIEEADFGKDELHKEPGNSLPANDSYFPEEDDFVRLMFFGDMMLDRYIGDVIGRKGLDYLFEDIRGEENEFFQGFDIIGANLEGAVTDEGSHYPPNLIYDFAFSPTIIGELKKYNFNYFTIANNHFSDQGERGMLETRKNLDKLAFNYSGCKDRKADKECSIKTMEIKNRKIALLAFSMVYGVLDTRKVEEIVREAKKTNDFVLVNIHWGVEYKHKFNKTQSNTAHAIIDAGADAIIGHHPHVVQGMEIYKNKAIFYSLGNFIFDQSEPYFPKANSESLAVRIEFSKDKTSYHLFPIFFDKWKLRQMTKEEKQEFFKNFSDWSLLGDKSITEDYKIIVNNK